MSDAAITPVAGGQFTPRTLVAVRVSTYTMNLYPVFDENMGVHERAHAYHVNKAALAAQTIPIRLQLDALGNQLNLGATMDGVLQEWTRYFQDHWSNFRHLKILSFHDTKGDMMSDTTSKTEPARLLPVQDGNVADCRKQGSNLFVCNYVWTSRPLLLGVFHPNLLYSWRNITSSCHKQLKR